jgi:hypothetical protein
MSASSTTAIGERRAAARLANPCARVENDDSGVIDGAAGKERAMGRLDGKAAMAKGAQQGHRGVEGDGAHGHAVAQEPSMAARKSTASPELPTHA